MQYFGQLRYLQTSLVIIFKLLMNANEAPIQLSIFLQNRKPTLEQLAAFVKQLLKDKNIDPLVQRMGILNQSTRSLLYVARQMLESLTRFKYEICYQPILSSVKRTQRRKSTAIANTSRARQDVTRKKQITMQQILAETVERSISHNNSSISATPKREITNFQQVYTPHLPQLQTEPISQQHFGATAESNRFMRQGTAATTAEEKMMTYHKFLAGDNEPLNVTRAPSLSTTRRKRSSTKRKAALVTDDDIYLSQGNQKQKKLQQLSTKIKISRQLQGNQAKTFKNQTKDWNPKLITFDILKDKLKLKVSQFRELQEINYQDNIPQEIDRSFMQPNTTESNFIINESNSPTITTAIQQKLATIIEAEQFMEPQVNFQQFCRKRNIKKEIKGQLFYQLLHMDFPLQQQSPQIFSDIFINNK